MRPMPRFWQGLGSPVLLVSGWLLDHEQLRQTLSTPEILPGRKRDCQKQNLSVVLATASLHITAFQVSLSLIPSLSHMALMPLIRFREGCFALSD